MKNQLEQMREQYQNTQIPAELDHVVQKTLQAGVRKNRQRRSQWQWFSATAAIIVLLTIAVNTSPTIANALAEVPLLKNVVRVLTFRDFTVHEGTFNADIQVPQISGLENKELEEQLNSQYLEENRRLYEEFIEDMEKLKAAGGGHLGFNSGYVVKTDNEQILVIGRYYVNTVGSSSTTFKYDTIDKVNQVLITLPSLFKDDSYVERISTNIKEQMLQQVKEDSMKTYFLDYFTAITPDQNFYLNSDGKIVISFNKYEVAPGYMGVVEFVIQTELISDLLVSAEYVR